MANILLTQKCVRSCPYCFAKDNMESAEANAVMSWQNMLYLADMLEASKENHVSLLGGEPTIHPHFIDYVLYLLHRSFHVTVFTSGVISPRLLAEMEKHLSKVHSERLSFVCNLNHPDISPADELNKTKKFLTAFAPFITPGFNIYRPDFDLTFIFDYIQQYGLRRHVRLGLTHPIQPAAENAYLHLADMRKMASRLMEFSDSFLKLQTTPGFDCGFPVCIFTDEQIGVLYKAGKGRLSFRCGPAIDIGPDMTVWPCFPLHEFEKKSVFDFSTVGEIGKYYSDLMAKTRAGGRSGIFEECNDCEHLQGLCSAGCLAYVLMNKAALSGAQSV